MFKIHVESGAATGRTFLAPRDLTEGHIFVVGRQDGCDIVLPADHVSSHHGQFVVQDEALFYQDCQSTNGSVLLRGGERTVLGEETGWAVRLCDEDRLLLGGDDEPVRLRVELEAQSVGLDPASMSILALSHLHTVEEIQGRVRQDARWGARLYQASSLLGASLDLEAVCKATCAAVFSLLPEATNVIVSLDQRKVSADHQDAAPTRQDLVPFYAVRRQDQGQPLHGEKPSRHVVSQVLDERVAVVIGDVGAADPSRSIVRARIQSIIGAPLMIGDRITGLVQVDNRDGLGSFGQADLEALLVLLSQAALSLENARLFARLSLAEERLTTENHFLKARQKRSFSEIIGESEAMKHVFSLVERVVDTRATVLVTGETGTGKELIAQAIHQKSPRHNKLFIAQNCSALPESLLESELFGHKRGAFTGADADKKGLFELAHQGTIFLDEIGETTPALQSKLLRVLQESELRPVGSMTTRKIDVRVIAATNRDLDKEVEEGRFREDLFYRLNVFPVHLPPLRERGDDILLLMDFFLARFCKEFGRPSISLAPETAAILKTHRWPGNIRELQNEAQRLVIHGVSGDLVMPEHLAARMSRTGELLRKVGPTKGSLKETMDQVERWILIEALREHKNNKTHTAASLQITREGLHKKLSRHGL